MLSKLTSTFVQSKSFSFFVPTLLEISELGMPSLSPTMEEGEIVQWLIKEGDSFKEGDSLCSIQTDKATLDLAATDDGILAKIICQAETKERVKVGKTIALVAEDEEDLKNIDSFSEEKIEVKKEEEEIKEEEKTNEIPEGLVELEFPSLSPSMTEGEIVSWNKKEGELIGEGDVICSIQTDKATVDFQATEEGYLAKILIPAGTGEKIKIGELIALVAEEKSQIENVRNFEPKKIKKEEIEKEIEKENEKEIEKENEKKIEEENEVVTTSSGERFFISPLALNYLEENSNFSRKDLPNLVKNGSLKRSGQYNSIIISDIKEFIESDKPKKTVEEPKKIKEETKKIKEKPKVIKQEETIEYEDIPLTPIREVIAKRLKFSKQNIPHYYLTIEIQVDKLLEMREEINKLISEKGTKISVNDLIVKAAAQTLKQFPEVNSGWIEKENEAPIIRNYKNADICVAVQTDSGLITPIVKKAQTLGVLDISKKIKELAGKAKEGKLTPEEFQGGSFTISNLGMFGIDQFAAVINPPQSTILAVGKVQRKVIENPKYNEKTMEYEPQFTVAQTMTFTLSCDHRVVDGAVSAQWFQVFKKNIENPILLSI